MSSRTSVQVLVIGSGAGGAVTALELASHGIDVAVLEEGQRWSLDDYGAESPTAMQRLYRRRGMTPIVGSVPVGYVEGCCYGGSTEINSGFWHRTPPETLLRWRSQYGLDAATPAELAPHFEWAEQRLSVGVSGKTWPTSTALFAQGAEKMGWSAHEVPRAAHDCQNNNTCASGCPKGAKQGMSRSLLPAAESAGARVMTGCRVKLLLRRGDRITGVLAEQRQPDGSVELLRIDAEHVIVCAGTAETPALLRRSGLRFRVGDSLRVHPMLKVVARFPDTIDAHASVLPLIQVKEFQPELCLGGAFYSVGHLSMVLGENWPQLKGQIAQHRNMASYYIAVRGTGRGSVKASFWDESPTLRYEVSDEDMWNLSRGLARLSMILLAAGAETTFPGVYGLPEIRTDVEAVRWLDDRLDRKAVSLTTVHAFSSCPIGERRDRCAADSFGRVHGMRNLRINDASMLPDSPGVNPQGSVMALARRNALHLVDEIA